MREAWTAWFAKLDKWYPQRGSDLAESARCSDSEAMAEKVLQEAEKRGLIARFAFEPSHSQRCFGVGGMAFRHLIKNEDAKDFHTTLWSWRLA